MQFHFTQDCEAEAEAAYLSEEAIGVAGSSKYKYAQVCWDSDVSQNARL